MWLSWSNEFRSRLIQPVPRASRPGCSNIAARRATRKREQLKALLGAGLSFLRIAKAGTRSHGESSQVITL